MRQKFNVFPMFVPLFLLFSLPAFGAEPTTATANTPGPKELATGKANLTPEALLSGIDAWVGKVVTVEGTAVHICGVDKKKLKLKGDQGAMIKIEYSGGSAVFDPGLKDQRIRVTGVVAEKRVDEAAVAELEKQQVVVCHVDREKCKSVTYLDELKKKGEAEKILQAQIEALRKKIQDSGKGYFSVVTIAVERLEVVKPPDGGSGS